MNTEYNKIYSKYFKYVKKIDDISNKDDVFKNKKELEQIGFSRLEPILSPRKPYLYLGEELKDYQSQYCVAFDNESANKRLNRGSNKKAMRILTYNVHNWVSKCPKEDNNYRNIDKFIEQFAKIDADVLCLQEVKPTFDDKIMKDQYDKDIDITDDEYIRKNCNFKTIIKKMKNIGYEYYFIIPNINTPIKQKFDYYYLYCNAIFSKYPFQEIEGYTLPANRTFITAKIMYHGKPIRIYNTHIEYYNEPDILLEKNGLNPLGALNDITSLQIDLLVLFAVSKIKNEKIYDVIMCGDFNKPYHFPIIKKNFLKKKRFYNIRNNYKLLLNFFTNSMKNEKEKDFTNFSHEIITDYIFISKYFMNTYSITKTSIIKSDLSDHYAVLMDFIMKS